MHDLVAEVTVVCPTCWESNAVALDLSVTPESLIEDCQVCCNPMLITPSVEDGRVVAVETELAQ